MKYQTLSYAKAILLLITWIVPLSVAYAAGNSNSGRIIFTGMIVDGMCEVSSDKAGVVQTCTSNNQTTTSRLNIDQNANAAVTTAKGLKGSTMNFRWIDKSKNLAVTEVVYN